MAAADSATAAAQPAPSADGTYSGTNVQVAGVDEPDIVKTDGERILAIAGGKLHLVSVAEGRELGAVELPGDLGITDLLLAGDRALVVGSSWTAVPFAEDVPGGAIPDDGGQPRIVGPSVPTTVVAEVDIAGDGLSLGDTFILDGSYVSARMTDDVVRLVLHADPPTPFRSSAPPYRHRGGDRRAAQRRNRAGRRGGRTRRTSSPTGASSAPTAPPPTRAPSSAARTCTRPTRSPASPW